MIFLLRMYFCILWQNKLFDWHWIKIFDINQITNLIKSNKFTSNKPRFCIFCKQMTAGPMTQTGIFLNLLMKHLFYRCFIELILTFCLKGEKKNLSKIVKEASRIIGVQQHSLKQLASSAEGTQWFFGFIAMSFVFVLTELLSVFVLPTANHN